MDTVINSFVEKSKEILQDNLVGVYLHGSAVMGCYNPSRVLAYIKDGLVLSKKEGGEWALKNFHERYHSLIQDALIEYAEDRNISYDTNLAKDYAKYMVNQIAR